MSEHLSHATLKAKQRAIRADFPQTMGLRAHRKRCVDPTLLR